MTYKETREHNLPTASFIRAQDRANYKKNNKPTLTHGPIQHRKRHNREE